MATVMTHQYSGSINVVAGAEEIKDSTLNRTASPASKALPESRPRRLMSLALPCVATDTHSLIGCTGGLRIRPIPFCLQTCIKFYHI